MAPMEPREEDRMGTNLLFGAAMTKTNTDMINKQLNIIDYCFINVRQCLFAHLCSTYKSVRTLRRCEGGRWTVGN